MHRAVCECKRSEAELLLCTQHLLKLPQRPFILTLDIVSHEGLRQDVSAGMADPQAPGSEHIHHCSKQLLKAELPLPADQILLVWEQTLISPPEIFFWVITAILK